VSKTHPHVQSPTEAQLREVVRDRPAAIGELYVEMHRLVLETLPDVEYSVDLTDAEIGYGAHQYGYNGWGMAAVTPYAKWVSLALLRATSLDDPAGLLEGTGTTIRHVKVPSLARLADIKGDLVRLLEAAARVNGS